MTRWRVVLLGVVGALTVAAVAGASEQSKLLYSRGLVEFHADRLQPALELFDKAVAADAEDSYARYYRAVTRARLGDLNGAIADLRAALSLRPDFAEAALELGIALVQAQRFAEAIPYLQQAQAVPDLDAQASQFLGIAQLRLGDRPSALRNFERAARDPKQRVAARYYIGIIAYQEGRLDDADQSFTEVVSASPDSDVGREAKAFLTKIAAERGPRRRYESYAMGGFQYDSNVVLAPSGDVIKSALGISQQGDGRAVFGAGLRAQPWRTERAQLTLGYDFYQSLQFELTDFNLQDHGPSIELAGKVGPVRLGLLGRYDYYLLQTNSFLQEPTAWPWVTIPNGEFGRTELYFRMRRRDFKQIDYAIRDAFNYATGLAQYLYVQNNPDKYVMLGYQYDEDDPVIPGGKYRMSGLPYVTPEQYVQEAKAFGYNGNQVQVGGGWLLPYDVLVEAWYAYRYESYARESDGRADNESLAYLAFRKPIRDNIDIVAAYFGDYNRSSEPQFTYDRSIGSLTFEVRY